MSNKHSVEGKTFNRLTILSRVGPTKVKCRCSCGSIVETTTYSVTSGKSKSCGCLNKEVQSLRLTRHGLSGTPTYGSWTAMTARCSNPNSEDYHTYGGRGITVCGRWAKFENFLEDMGVRPEGKTLDRKDTNGNYEPGNCRWATPKEQAQNRVTKGVYLEVGGVRKSLGQWADDLSLNRGTVYNRYKRYGDCPDLVLATDLLHSRSGNRR